LGTASSAGNSSQRASPPRRAERDDLRSPSKTAANREAGDTSVEQARQDVPIGVINPSRNYLAGDLRGTASTGAGRHWWARVTSGDLKARQLPDPVGHYRRPAGW